MGMGATDRMLCFALYSASRKTIRAYREFLDPWNLTYPQYLVLYVLWNQGPQTVRKLGEEMELDSGTLSPLLSARAQTAAAPAKVAVSMTARKCTSPATTRS